MTTDRLHGIIAAVPTPVDDGGVPDTERFRLHARWALENGCDAINVLGTTGEANSLPVTFRKRIMTTASVGLDGKRLMVGTGMCDLATTAELTRLAFQLRYAAALVLPPFYYKDISQRAVLEWFARLVIATKEAPIPIYIYNYPKMTGVRVEYETAKDLHTRFPDRIFGMKDSSGDQAFAAKLAQIEGFDVFPGSEAILAGDREDQFAGCISATVNITAPHVASMLANPNDDRQRIEAIRLREAIASQPLVPAVKYLVARLHGDSVFEAVLPPNRLLSNDQKADLDRRLAPPEHNPEPEPEAEADVEADMETDVETDAPAGEPDPSAESA